MHRAAFEVRGDEAREFGEAGAGHQCRLHQIAKRRLAGVDQASRLVNRQDAVALALHASERLDASAPRGSAGYFLFIERVIEGGSEDGEDAIGAGTSGAFVHDRVIGGRRVSFVAHPCRRRRERGEELPQALRGQISDVRTAERGEDKRLGERVGVVGRRAPAVTHVGDVIGDRLRYGVWAHGQAYLGVRAFGVQGTGFVLRLVE
jgi:hypothetical protein